MAQFAFGFIIGMLLVTTLTHTSPRSIIGVNNELIKANMAYYHPVTGEVIWKECNKWIK